VYALNRLLYSKKTFGKFSENMALSFY